MKAAYDIISQQRTVFQTKSLRFLKLTKNSGGFEKHNGILIGHHDVKNYVIVGSL